jgi:hypothetical protein
MKKSNKAGIFFEGNELFYAFDCIFLQLAMQLIEGF